ncbi:hypothetical protein ACGFK1_18475 [Mycobacterium sp. NPDC048908]|uniref:hypothetical protein n=1 Tax=Mycobacterium sp. NPDC048908 TaxID=3364292 RepID=UPI003711F30D
MTSIPHRQHDSKATENGTSPDIGQSAAGFGILARPWFAERQIAALGYDGDSTWNRTESQACRRKSHVLGITAMGLPFFDGLGLEDLAVACGYKEGGRRIADPPIRLHGDTGASSTR